MISCLPEFSVTEIDVNSYIDIFRSVLKNTGKIEIRYQGVSASPNCIVIQGFPISDTLERLRNELRTQLIEAGVRVTFDSRYKLVTAHSSIIRFKAPLNDAQQLQEDIRIDPSRIALVGISMGALSTFYSLTQNNQIKVAVPILGSPDFVGLEKFALKADSDNKTFNEDEKLAIRYMKEIDPCLYLLENESRPMLIINGERDDWVPAKFAKDFFEKVKSKYDKNNTEIAFNLADESHYFSNDMRDHTICWLNKHL
ncbi:alpha/beta hydrolase family protein [Vibrio sp. nBUS_14]|uniref:alpha/beta hydrolase family protein n=1 Tax=Vibrio sp. nBUS_14 TaxID=3395321 RepID=UPI003EBD7FAB